MLMRGIGYFIAVHGADGSIPPSSEEIRTAMRPSRPRGWSAQVAFANGMAKSEMSATDHAIRKRCPVWARSAACSFAFACFRSTLPGFVAWSSDIDPDSFHNSTSVQLLQHVPMKTGEPLEGRLLYPVYVENRIAIPAGTVLRGSVIQLDSDRSRRIHSRLRGDFTPFHIPVVRFDQLVLPDGTLQPIVSDSATDGVPILRLSPPPGKKKGSFIARQIAQEKQRLKDTAASIHRTRPRRPARSIHL